MLGKTNGTENKILVNINNEIYVGEQRAARVHKRAHVRVGIDSSHTKHMVCACRGMRRVPNVKG